MTDTPRLVPDYPILTERLALRPIDKERDLPAIHAYRSIPEVCRYVPFVPSTLEEMTERFADPDRTRSVLDAQAEGQVLFTVIERRDTGELIGDLVLFWHSVADGHAEPPSAPGLGVELDFDLVAQHPYRPLAIREYATAEGAVPLI